MSHQKGRLKNSKFWLCLSLILCLVSAIVASAVQTSGGIRIKEMSWESPSGHQLAAYLYIPQNATKDTPAPGVVTIEGWYNNKEIPLLYAVTWVAFSFTELIVSISSLPVLPSNRRVNRMGWSKGGFIRTALLST